MVTKRKARSNRVKTLREGKLDSSRTQKVRGGYIGETEKLRGASSRYGCDASGKDRA